MWEAGLEQVQGLPTVGEVLKSLVSQAARSFVSLYLAKGK